jgi:phosphoenolpyruvate---glycerone phosphotransferase subunit DhaL
VQGRQALDRSSIVALLDEIVGALSARGGAALGDKTMLDSLHAVSRALAECGDGANLRTVAREAASGALDAMRSQPNRIGRARMFADKSVGADDPGMVAVLRMVESL